MGVLSGQPPEKREFDIPGFEAPSVRQDKALLIGRRGMAKGRASEIGDMVTDGFGLPDHPWTVFEEPVAQLIGVSVELGWIEFTLRKTVGGGRKIFKRVEQVLFADDEGQGGVEFAGRGEVAQVAGPVVEFGQDVFLSFLVGNALLLRRQLLADGGFHAGIE